MTMPFEGFDFTEFWDDSDYAKKEYVSDSPTEELIASVQEELGYRLPESYLWLMKRHNGGIPVNTCYPTETPTSWAEDHVAITGIFGIGREKHYSLCGKLGSQFMIDEWEYPDIGVAICDCPSAGHDMIFLDYRECGPQGEPKVVHVDQECDYEITPLADSFESFIRGLVNEEEYEEDEEERREAELKTVRSASFSRLLTELCVKSGHPEETEEWIRAIGEEIVEEKGCFALHDDEKSMLLYDIQFYLYTNAYPGVTEGAYLEVYPKIIALDGGFSTGGYAPGFVTDWLNKRKEECSIVEQEGILLLSESVKAELLAERNDIAAKLPHDLKAKLDRWYQLDRHQSIVDAILSLRPDQRNDDLLGRLAVAYNNLDEYDKAIEVLEILRPRQENSPKYHYRLGYALYYSGRLREARGAFTRALMLDPPENIAEDCREFLEWITEEYMQGEEYTRRKEECAGTEPELYAEEDMEAVENHISQYYGKFDLVWHELVSPDIHVDICIISPSEERNYYTLVTMGMGAHKMNVPESLAGQHMERAELIIRLPADWRLGDNDESWYWPARLLKQLARMPGECDTWLGWGHTVDNQEPYADNTALCGALLINPQAVQAGADTAELPGGETLRFYQIVPIYQEEMEYKQRNDADALLDKLAEAGFVVDPKRTNVCAETETDSTVVMDHAACHLESIREKHLPVDELTACNHLAIYLRWCMEHDLMSEEFMRRYPEKAARVKATGGKEDLREFLRGELHGMLLFPYFNGLGEAFARYYYGDNRKNPSYPSDIDGHALQYFGEKRYHCDEFQDEAYLFVPFDEAYYQAMAQVISRRWEEWQAKLQELEKKKNYGLKKEDIKQRLTNWDGPEGCIATDRITVDGCKVGYCYREKPDGGYPDSGWRFTAGDETDEYMDDPENAGIYALNTICNYDPEILPLLDAPYGAAFLRDENGVFRKEAYEPREEEEGAEPSALACAMMEYLACPCLYFPPMEDDDPLMAAYQDAKKRGSQEGFVPVFVAVDETLWECLILNSDEDSDGGEDYDFNPEQVTKYRRKMLSGPLQSGREVLDRFLKDRREEAEDDDMNWEEDILGQLCGGEESNRFSGYWDYRTNNTVPLILAEIPVRNPWEIFAYLPFGGWNECPDTPELMAVVKYWHELYSAVPAVVTHDELEFTVSAPVCREQALRLALEQYAWCPDVVDQGPEDATVGTLADTLSRSKVWYFWWD